ncbi:MAG: NAD(P)/FAD-dependent oxidoreductase [Acidobacteriota bacterium]|nr:NAD(P)/FAD-dependent oxidoreductase [Acidobacteriota bacterium]
MANSYDVAIAGAGPAGTSAAIQLASAGRRVLLLEEKKFPRSKLCGEFISPECLPHFQQLGVVDEMIAAGGAAIGETVFYTRRGHSVAVPSQWFESGADALGLSRSEMDHRLLERAKSVGVTVLEDAHASGVLQQEQRVCGLIAKTGETLSEYSATVTIDATGRTRALARHVEPPVQHRKKKRTLVASKAHLTGARPAGGACEIYFYPNGYGGLSRIEAGRSNLCFIVAAEDVRNYGSDPEIVMREVVMKNVRAAFTLAEAEICTSWLSVSLDGFGRRSPAPVPGLLTVGDAASFIDPFTGSGMLMALESGDLAAMTINRHFASLSGADSFAPLSNDYESAYSEAFDARLRVSGYLRRAAFVPGLAEAAIVVCGASSGLRRRLARATRHSGGREISPLSS